MHFPKIFFCLTFLVTNCLAVSIPPRHLNIVPCHDAGLEIPCQRNEARKIVRVVRDTISVPTVHQEEDINFAVNRTSSGFSRVTRDGVPVQIGILESLAYNITVTALSTEMISALNETIVERLNDTELEQYNSLVDSYDNGLSVPFLALLGIDLGGVTNRDTITNASMEISRYNELSSIVAILLESTEETQLSMRGSLIATGLSFTSVEAFVFIRTARIVFNDGSSRLVVTSDPAETEAGTIMGDLLPSTDKTLSVFEQLADPTE